MRDRLSTKILSNGATRYGVYDETGGLLRYEYIKLEDEPTVEGDFFSKANMLPDSIPAALGLKMGNPQVKDALNVLAHVGNLHVWERVQSGVTDYLTSTDRNAYPDSSTITYLGQLGGSARIEVGSYVGTNTYGADNPNSLTFWFKPKIVKLLFRTSTKVGRGDLKNEDLTGEGINLSQNFMVADRLTTNYAQGEGFGYSSSSSYGKKSPDGKTFYWYSTNAANQCNSSVYVYYYIAIC